MSEQVADVGADAEDEFVCTGECEGALAVDNARTSENKFDTDGITQADAPIRKRLITRIIRDSIEFLSQSMQFRSDSESPNLTQSDIH